ncbi:MAG TPA: sigma-54 dependent transcriptional regulator [Terriglobales bacterium]|nr:sigma-54 dependent transcriptional regulator [Terriglobales bacterium]
MSAGHILVVDDEPSMLRYLQTVLELDSYRVSTASNGMEALDKVQREPPDLVLLDMVMPGADGLETLQRIREARPSTKVVMLSCVRDTRKVAQAMRLGAQDYLSKPVQKEEMDEVLRFCLWNSDPAEPCAGDTIEVGDGVSFFCATPMMRQLRTQALQVAKFDFPVLLLGESGTGKEVLAKLIHKYSDRAHRTFLKVNCAAVPSELLESELFGYEPGAFTGANKSKPGKFELCNKGTLLLDEIGEMSPALQAKLLQVLQDGQFSRLGGRVTVKVDVRVLAATNINMPQAIAQKTFREDLYYRLNSFVLRMPSLRERREEIPMILRHFMIQLADRYACAPLAISQRLLEACEGYSWPGNIRELENFVKRFLVLGDEAAAIAELQKAAAPQPPTQVAAPLPEKPQIQPNLKEMVRHLKNGAESEVIAQVLEETAWNRKRAAVKLNISYKALLYKIRQYDIRPRQAE